MEEEVDRQGRSSIALEVLPLRTYGKYVASLVMSVCLANVLLAVSGRDDLAIYMTVNIMVCPVISLLTAYTDPGAGMTLATAGTVLFGCSMAVVIPKAVGTSPGR